MQSLSNRVVGPSLESLSAEFIHYRIALPVDWFNIFLLSLTVCWSQSYASKNKLVANDFGAKSIPAMARRIVVTQSLYACGAVFCFLNTYDAIAAIVLAEGDSRARAKVRFQPVYAQIWRWEWWL